MSDATIRCTACGGEFDDAPRSACPSCGSAGTPMLIADDITLSINLHELRCLTIWASNFAEKFDDDGKRALHGILGRIRKQLPRPIALTMSEEFDGLRQLGDVEVHKSDGTVEKLPARKPS